VTKKHDQPEGEQPADRGEQGTVAGPEFGSCALAAEHGELMVQNEDLKILGSVAASEQREQLDGTAQCEVGEFGRHQRWPPRGRQRAQCRAAVWREPAAQRPPPTLRTLHPRLANQQAKGSSKSTTTWDAYVVVTT
jgi:hypothetical protein